MKLVCVTREHKVENYFPIPRELLRINMPKSALILYGVLLDKMTLSQRNRWVDEKGRAFVRCTQRHIAEQMNASLSCVEKDLRILQNLGLVRREREVGRLNNRYFLYLPVPGQEDDMSADRRDEMPAFVKQWMESL